MSLFNPVILEYIDTKTGRRFFIQKEKKTLYLYITSKDFRQNYCNPIWIANLCEAPDTLNMNKVPVLLPKQYIKNPLKVIPSTDIKMRLQDGLLQILCSNNIICVVLDPFGNPVGFNANIKGDTIFGHDMDMLKEYINK
jgi:hypothetical protein